MAAPKQERLLAALPHRLQALAVDLSSEGSFEYAFPVANCDEVFEALVASGFVPTGGDLWEPLSDGFGSTGEGWYFQRDEGSSAAETLTLARRRWDAFRMTLLDGDVRYVTFMGSFPENEVR
nr:hypothetical protein GCM10010200_020730 [Actinomadura rugatobispora]